MHPVLERAIEDARLAFGTEHVTAIELGDGSVRVCVRNRDVGAGWRPQLVDITATLLVSFPTSPPYPFYLPADLSRLTGAMPSNLTRVTLDGNPFTQLSVRPEGNRAVESFPALISGVVSWMRTR